MNIFYHILEGFSMENVDRVDGLHKSVYQNRIMVVDQFLSTNRRSEHTESVWHYMNENFTPL